MRLGLGPWQVWVIVMGPKMPQVLEFVFDDFLNTLYLLYLYMFLSC